MTYTREQIKEAIRAELTASDFMGEDKDRYHMIVGVVMEGLDRIDTAKNISGGAISDDDAEVELAKYKEAINEKK